MIQVVLAIGSKLPSLLRRGPGELRHKAVRTEEVFGTKDIPSFDQEIEVPAEPVERLGVEPLGEERSLEGYYRDVVVVKQPNHPAELADQKQVRCDDGFSLQRNQVDHRARYAKPLRPSRHKNEPGRNTVFLSQIVNLVPVQLDRRGRDLDTQSLVAVQQRNACGLKNELLLRSGDECAIKHEVRLPASDASGFGTSMHSTRYRR